MSSRWRWPSISEPMTVAIRAACVAAALAGAASLSACGAFRKADAPAAPAAAAPAKDAPKVAASVAQAPAAPKAPARPARPPGPAFNHQNHLGRGVGCLDCHEGADTKDKAALPTLEQCMECHEEIEPEAPPEKKVAQFVADAATSKMRWHEFTKQSPEVRFSHAKHAAKGVECLQCHAGMDANQRTGPELFLTMDACMACHTAKKASNECAVCHTKVGREWKPGNHDAAWRGLHGGVWKLGSPTSHAENCTLCHSEPQCSDCHAKTPPADHTAAFRVGPEHGAMYQTRSSRCAMCHTEQSLCVDCHHTTPPQDHTPMWRGSPAHGIASESRPERCATCHEETTCMSCHRDTPPRDHTNFWRTGPGHGLAARMDRERCSSCHTTDQCVECHTSNPPRSHRGSWGSPRNRHCVNCHDDQASPSAEGGCGVCHTGTPSHRLAPPKPSDHTPDLQCLLCHDRLRHPIGDGNCNQCHR